MADATMSSSILAMEAVATSVADRVIDISSTLAGVISPDDSVTIDDKFVEKLQLLSRTCRLSSCGSTKLVPHWEHLIERMYRLLTFLYHLELYK